jgi:hypothetical protein
VERVGLRVGLRVELKVELKVQLRESPSGLHRRDALHMRSLLVGFLTMSLLNELLPSWAARGTFEPGPFGVIVGDPLVQAIKSEMKGEDVRGYAVQVR